jgi:hypothetical protein
VAGEVFPRCKTLVNPNEPDYNKLQCAETVNPSLFSTNCVKAGLSDTKPAEYGCPIIPDATVWMDYTGVSCHYPDNDRNSCANGAVMRRVAVCCGEDGKYNICQADDFTNLDSLKNVDKRGISNPRVSGVALVRQDHAGGDDIYALVSADGIRDSNFEKNLANINANDRANNVCYFGGVKDRWVGRYAGASFDFGTQYPNV